MAQILEIQAVLSRPLRDVELEVLDGERAELDHEYLKLPNWPETCDAECLSSSLASNHEFKRVLHFAHGLALFVFDDALGNQTTRRFESATFQYRRFRHDSTVDGGLPFFLEKGRTRNVISSMSHYSNK